MDETNGRKRAKRSKRYYRDASGDLHARPVPDVRAIIVEFPSGYEAELDMTQLSQEVLSQAAAFGLMTSACNAFGGLSSEDESIEALEARFETYQAGRWASERAGSGETRESDLVRAMREAKAEAGEPDWDPSAFIEGLKSGSIDKAAVRRIPQIEAKLATYRAERAAERARRAAEKAETQASDLSDF